MPSADDWEETWISERFHALHAFLLQHVHPPGFAKHFSAAIVEDSPRIGGSRDRVHFRHQPGNRPVLHRGHGFPPASRREIHSFLRTQNNAWTAFLPRSLIQYHSRSRENHPAVPYSLRVPLVRSARVSPSPGPAAFRKDSIDDFLLTGMMKEMPLAGIIEDETITLNSILPLEKHSWEEA